MSAPATIHLVPGCSTHVDLALISEHHAGQAYITVASDPVLDRRVQTALSTICDMTAINPSPPPLDQVKSDIARLSTDINTMKGAINTLTAGMASCNEALQNLSAMLQEVQRPVIQYEPQF